MTPIEVFLWGWGGSIAVDLMTLARHYEATEIKFPERYTRVGYYICRILVAMVAGGLAVAYGIDKPILAINIGASAPLIIQALSQGFNTQSVSRSSVTKKAQKSISSRSKLPQ